EPVAREPTSSQPVLAESASGKQDSRARECLPVTTEALTTPAERVTELAVSVSLPIARDCEGSGTPEDVLPVVATSIPYAAPLDRVCTVLGLIEEAPVSFASAEVV